MIRSIKIWILLIAVFFSVNVTAQKAKPDEKVIVKADTLRRQIGQQVVLTINVQIPDSKRVTWPLIPDSLGQIEVISRSPIDTSRLSGKNWILYSQKLIVTSFDTGFITFPKLTFKTSTGKDTSLILSDEVLLKYASVPVDTTKAIKDIKGIMAAPLTVGEVAPWILAIMIFGALVIIIYTIYLRKKSKKPLILFKPKPELPAHLLALEALDHLKNEALWKKGKIKEYYTGLTDILRNYLEKRFGVMAQEMTSDEILEALKVHANDGLMIRLRNLFFTADMVKFAKGVPEPNENDVNLDIAYDFVQTTKPLPEAESTNVESLKTNAPTTKPNPNTTSTTNNTLTN